MVYGKDAIPIVNPNHDLQWRVEWPEEKLIIPDSRTDLNEWRTQKDWDSSSDIGINLKGECITWMWKWCLKLDYLLWWKDSNIAKRNENRTVLIIAQDVVLAATYMVWTVLTIVLIYCWLMYILSARGWKDPSNYRRWLVRAAVWACLVRWAYAIVKLIQYIAKW